MFKCLIRLQTKICPGGKIILYSINPIFYTTEVPWDVV